ncbi:CinA family protein [Sphingosinicella soli]|uniref:Nicotinamide-nucleotide amidase n=1 Tax=Sphingosinicella soli TaxID=333708 RepID=A0A7W7B0Z1_9SPHN|nr:CinA family protein [Sphingosinicella soli]MBB4630975.1 nicotinamide-nucleotide amidase [Sphingosinicella soli]
MAETLSPALPDALERAVHALLQRLHDAGVRIGTAESCTGGLLASLLTDVSGFGHVFESGLVVYTDAAKQRLLGIDPGLIERHGAVSHEVAVAMAEGLLAISDVDIALAITGFAGPAGEGEEPGLVYLARAGRTTRTVFREEHFGDIGRGATRLKCIEAAIRLADGGITDEHRDGPHVPSHAV